VGLECAPGHNDGVFLAYQHAVIVAGRARGGGGPPTSGSFWSQSALSAMDPRTWAMLPPAEMKGDVVYDLSRLEAACKSHCCCAMMRSGTASQRQGSNHTRRRQHLLVSSGAMRCVKAAATGGSSINLRKHVLPTCGKHPCEHQTHSSTDLHQ
jgi:hypothetical protein